MNRRLLTAVSAAALSLSLLAAVPAGAQEQQLSDSAATGMSALGMDTTGVMVTADQAAMIENVLGSTDQDDIKRGRIQQILGNEATATGRLGTGQLRSSVSADMAALGMDTSMIDTLQVEQLAAIENVSGSQYTDDQKRQQITEIVGGNIPGAGAMGANDDAVMADVASLGIDTSKIGVLSADQMTQIQTVLSGTEADDIKRGRINQIIAK